MRRYQTKTDPESGEVYLPVSLRGRALLTDSMFNKGTAFTHDERVALGIDGLLPPAICTIEQQLERVYENYRRQADDLDPPGPEPVWRRVPSLHARAGSRPGGFHGAAVPCGSRAIGMAAAPRLLPG